MLSVSLTFFSVCMLSIICKNLKIGILLKWLFKNRPKKGKIKRMLSMRYRLLSIYTFRWRYIIFSVCSAFAKDYWAYAQCTFKRQSMRLIINFYLNHHKNLKMQKILKIFLEPSERVTRASHTTLYFWLSWNFFGH